MSTEKSLSRQEEQVLRLARQGLGDKQIAQELGLSTDTVRTYWQRIRQKVGAATRAEIIATLSEKRTAAQLEAVENEKSILEREIELRKTTEKALRATEMEWRRLADSMPQMVFVAKADGNVFYHNARFHEFTGQTPEAAKDLGFLQVIHPEEAEPLGETIRESVSLGQPYEAEVRIRRHDGVYLWHMLRVVPYRNDNYEVIRWYGTSTDIHESKIVQDQLRRSEARLLQAHQIARLGYYEYNVESGEGQMSKDLLAMFGIPEDRGSLDLDAFLDLVDPADRERIEKAVRLATTEGDPFDEVFRIRVAKGKEMHVRSVARAYLKDRKVTRLVATIQDVSEQRLAALRQEITERRFQAITEASPNGIFVTDENDNCTYANARFREITGAGEKDVLGKGWARYLHPLDRDLVLKDWKKAKKQDLRYQAEFRCLREDGEERWVLLKTATMQLEAGKSGYVCVVQDITERTQRDAERERLISIVELTPDIVGMCDQSLHITDLNAAARRLFGVSETKPYPTVPVESFLPEWALEKVRREGIPCALSEGYWTGETAFFDKEGHEVPVSQAIIAHPGKEGKIAYFSTVARDISELKRTQLELNEQRHFVEQLLEANFDVVYVYDLEERRFVYVNRAIEAVWGYSIEFLLGNGGETFREYIHPEDLPRVDPHVSTLQSLKDNEIVETEFRILTSERGWCWMNSREAVFKRKEDGSVRQILGISADISHRKPSSG